MKILTEVEVIPCQGRFVGVVRVEAGDGDSCLLFSRASKTYLGARLAAREFCRKLAEALLSPKFEGKELQYGGENANGPERLKARQAAC